MKPEQTDADRARTLLDSNKLGTLSTLAATHGGYPFGSLLPYVLDADGNPIFTASRLAEHTANFTKDPRASLFVTDRDAGSNPLSQERVTVLGTIESIEPGELKKQYLDAHPDSAMYVDMKDFAFYRLTVESIRYVGGFGRMSWVEPPEYTQTRV